MSAIHIRRRKEPFRRGRVAPAESVQVIGQRAGKIIGKMQAEGICVLLIQGILAPMSQLKEKPSPRRPFFSGPERP